VFGEGGIGKSRLLTEATARLRNTSATVIYINMTSLPKNLPGTGEVLVRMLGEALSGESEVSLSTLDDIHRSLTSISRKAPVYLMFDTTEAFQEDIPFWEWLEEKLISPLVRNENVKFIFAGRIPVPWRTMTTRRAVQLLELGPLEPRREIAALIQEVLQHYRSRELDWEPQDLKEATDVVLSLSFGHPLLSEKLAASIASQWFTKESKEDIIANLCQEVVRPFVDDFLFASADPPWDKLLWWISPLEWFDATILQSYLKRVVPQYVENEPEIFYMKGLARLRTRDTLVWHQKHGTRLHGVIGKIARQCFRTLRPNDYNRALQAAADTYRSIAQDLEDDEEYARQYRSLAASYEANQH
jgi:hypothetical protein